MYKRRDYRMFHGDGDGPSESDSDSDTDGDVVEEEDVGKRRKVKSEAWLVLSRCSQGATVTGHCQRL